MSMTETKKCAKCNASLRYPEDADIRGTTVIDGAVCEVAICAPCKAVVKKDHESALLRRQVGGRAN